ncbi:MAG: SynChlorMet cassette radical SAM/SPASM protein ScmF [Methanospirillum sp.]|uniref:SynChlorMet cassette radical SAM/SPASM protein ScmF n=1 Tax=Methanospirillum sp. TaxID=45200 RepID=UPI00236FEC3A|nr:SynChlorMet cassette radical SAM/SPASM protein ScmF [Methanospirillum sp.]MDD1730007.1 SynChlorMet cassette radical SAM/SPASM protein ScmF [Methanospirillum sp.]
MTEQSKTKITHIPSLETLYFYLTGDCNMACRHCWIAPTFENSDRSQMGLPVDLLKKIITEAKEIGLSGVKLTGGEPLIHPDIIQILRYVRDQKLVLTIESNGVAINPHIADLIKSCTDPFISISIDGNRESHEWMRGVQGSFDRVSQGVKTLVETGIHPQVIMAVAGRNKGKMADLAKYAESIGASSVKYNFVTPTARGRVMEAEGSIVTVQEQIELSQWVQNELQKELKIPLMTNLPYAFRSLSSMYSPGGTCGRCGIFSILGVLSDGTYALCGIGTSVPELCFGHASRNQIQEIWEKAEALNMIREHLPKDLKGICSRCLMKNICIGQCIANNYYVKKDLLAGHKFCEDAFESGLFPQTRLVAE